MPFFAEGERLCPLASEECVAASMTVEVSEYGGQKSNDLVRKMKGGPGAKLNEA